MSSLIALLERQWVLNLIANEGIAAYTYMGAFNKYPISQASQCPGILEKSMDLKLGVLAWTSRGLSLHHTSFIFLFLKHYSMMRLLRKTIWKNIGEYFFDKKMIMVFEYS